MSILKEIKRLATDSKTAKDTLRVTLNGKSPDKPKPNGKVCATTAIAVGG